VDYPFFDLPDFLGSPHNASITTGAIDNAFRLAAEDVAAFWGGGMIKGEIRIENYVEE
jgi:phosphoglycerate dehydrogenase-like enzyme